MIKRLIALPPKRSFFLFGPRQTGKSTLIRTSQLFRKAWDLDLLHTDSFLKYAREPHLFRREVEYKLVHEGIQTVFVDEIQKVPPLLDEVQALLQAHPSLRFILTGSSPRKLKRGAANLLAGRLVQRRLFPFVHAELGEAFRLEEALIYGTLPPVHGLERAEKTDILAAYAETYLREEIQAEGIVRNLGGFSRFLDIAAAQCGELVNYTAIGRDAGLPTRTVQAYYEILEDTLIALRLPAWRRSARKSMTAHPKFYLFDTGVTNAINHRLHGEPDRLLRGRLFEQWIVLEAHRYLDYQQSGCRLYYWRTRAGAEVDLLIERGGKLLAACEIKASRRVSGADLTGLRSLREEHPKVPLVLVSEVDQPFTLEDVSVLPWKGYVERLSSGEWL